MELTESYYVADLDHIVFRPMGLSIAATVRSSESDGELVLTAGAYRKAWPLIRRMFTSGPQTELRVNDVPDKAFGEAVAGGAQGRLAILAKDGTVRESQDLVFVGDAQFKDLVAKAYPAALGFAADPSHSSYCEKSV